MEKIEKDLAYVKRRLKEACQERDFHLDRLTELTPKIKQYKRMIEELEENVKTEKERM